MTSSPRAKFIGDFGSTTEVIRIVDRFVFKGFTKKIGPMQLSTFATVSANIGSSGRDVAA